MSTVSLPQLGAQGGRPVTDRGHLVMQGATGPAVTIIDGIFQMAASDGQDGHRGHTGGAAIQGSCTAATARQMEICDTVEGTEFLALNAHPNTSQRGTHTLIIYICLQIKVQHKE